MLVLSRKNDESVVVGGTDGLRGAVKVTVLEIGNGIVRLGFEADKNVPVHREEVWERICARRPPDPPTIALHGTGSRNGDGKKNVLSGTGQGRSPKSVRDRV